MQFPPRVTFPVAVDIVKSSFSAAGFGLPPGTTNMDIATVLRSKGCELACPEYCILGFCSPSHAAQALAADPSMGLLLPCNVAIASSAEGPVEVSAMDPYTMLGLVTKKEEIAPLVLEIHAMVKAAMEGAASAAAEGP